MFHTVSSMGKAKRRNLTKRNSSIYMTRESAISEVRKLSCEPCFERSKVEDLITLFGLSAEELSENGVSYEHIKGLRSVCY